MKKIALLGSWKNGAMLDEVCRRIQNIDDFRDRGPSFNWNEIETADSVLLKCHHPFSRAASATDLKAIDDCEVALLVMPCGGLLSCLYRP